jgi:DNA-binding HxlR family transcriptional regulator
LVSSRNFFGGRGLCSVSKSNFFLATRRPADKFTDALVELTVLFCEAADGNRPNDARQPMSRRRFNEMNCSVAQGLDQIGDWWTLLIVREAIFGKSTFSGLRESLGIARNILTERLSHLVDHGILARKQVRPGVDRYSYHLTAKGLDLLPILVALTQWGDRWVVGRGAEPLRIIDAEQRKPIRRIVVTSADGRLLSLPQLRFRPGPGARPELRGRFARARKLAKARKTQTA